jgi:hypothetical protein
MTVELIEAARSGTADYEALYERMDKAISKVVLSQTMTTDDGSSRAQAQVHQGVADHVIKSDADLLCESFNRGPVRWLTAWKFPNAQPPRVWRHTEPAEDLQARAERDNKIFALGYAPTEQYIEETYGPGWEKKAEPELPPEDPKGPLPAEFTEFTEFTEISELALKRAGHRADQQALVHGWAVASSTLRLNPEKVRSCCSLRGSGGPTVGLPSGISLKPRKSRVGSNESAAEWAGFRGGRSHRRRFSRCRLQRLCVISFFASTRFQGQQCQGQNKPGQV